MSSAVGTTSPTILIVDDDPDAHTITQLALRPLNARFVAAWDGIASVAVARQEPPDLIILDVGLPAGDGFTVLKRLQRIPALARVPTIVLSARDREHNEDAARAAGADVYLQKPVDPGTLYATALRLLAPDNGAWA